MIKDKSIIFKQNKWIIFIFYGISSVLISLAIKNFLPFEEMIFNSLSEQLSIERINKVITNQKKWEWIGYFIIPILLLLKWALITLSIYIGTVFFDFKVSFKKLFHIVLVSEIVFLIQALVKFIWLYIHKENLTLDYVQHFQPLSLINLFEYSEFDRWLIYPLQALNLFELAYWFLLSFLLGKEIQKPFWISFDFVVSTYGVGLLIWLVFVAFLTLNFS